MRTLQESIMDDDEELDKSSSSIYALTIQSIVERGKKNSSRYNGRYSQYSDKDRTDLKLSFYNLLKMYDLALDHCDIIMDEFEDMLTIEASISGYMRLGFYISLQIGIGLDDDWSIMLDQSLCKRFFNKDSNFLDNFKQLAAAISKTISGKTTITMKSLENRNIKSIELS